MSFDQLLKRQLPLADAAAFFITVKGASAPDPLSALDEFWMMSRPEQGELLKEAGVTPDEFMALMKFAEQEIDLDSLMATEEAGAAAQSKNEASFYKQRSEQMSAALQAAQEQAAAQGEQMQALQGQVDGSTAQIQQATQGAQLTQQSALTQAQAAHQTATQATQQALQAMDESLKHQQLAAQMRMEYQGLRGRIMDEVSQDPAAGVGAQLSGSGLDSSPTSIGAPPPDMGPAGTAPSAGVPADAVPAMDGSQAGAAPTQGPAPTDGGGTQPASVQGIKESAASLRERIPYMLGGGLLGAAAGAGGTALEARQGHDDLRAKVQQLQSSPGSFGQAIDLAKAKAQLAIGEISENHPTAATLAGGLLGAGLVGAAGPELHEEGSKLVSRVGAALGRP